jgi:hypothetical protein
MNSPMRSMACWPSGSTAANHCQTWIISFQGSKVASVLAAPAPELGNGLEGGEWNRSIPHPRKLIVLWSEPTCPR